MFLIEIITEEGYWSGTATWETLELAQEVANGLRKDLAGRTGFIAVRVINMAFVTRW